MATVCALIAAYNEAQHIGEVVAGVEQALATFTSGSGGGHMAGARVFVVDDGSTDGTAERAEAAGATVIRHGTNSGKGQAIRTGLAHVLELPFTHVLFIDGDLQHQPSEVPRLLDRVARGHGDFVIGERELIRDGMPAARYYSNVIGSRILTWFIGTEVADSQSGFRVIRADLLRRLSLTSRRYEIETEILIKLARAGARIERVPVTRLYFEEPRSKIRPFRDTFRTCMLALGYRYFR